ncbi:MAG: hypothetical protein Ct9H300mP1_00280 [Planctomycetaceae bacterium]|nr:MAG: hypothetical protein Ct9H300mP1_00280 [Planctomycetaceae bacterium]
MGFSDTGSDPGCPPVAAGDTMEFPRGLCGFRPSHPGMPLPMPRPTTLLLLLLGCRGTCPRRPNAAPPKVDYRKQIKPLLARHCNGCHGAKKVMSGFRADAGRLATRGGDRGAGIVPGQPEKSLLFQVLTGTDDVERMPYEKPR